MKTITYKGHKITVEKMSGWIAVVEKGDEVISSDESTPVLDTKEDALENAKDFIDAIEELGKS